MTFTTPSVQGDGNVLLRATVNSAAGDCGQQNAFGCSATLALQAPSGNQVQGSSQLFWVDGEPTQLNTVVPIKGMAAGTYSVFAALVNGSGRTSVFNGPSFTFPTSSLRVSAVRVAREAGAVTLGYRVRDGGSLVGAAQQAKARTTVTLTRTGKAGASAKRFSVRLRPQPGANRHVLPYRVTRRIQKGERYRVTVEVRDRLKRSHEASAARAPLGGEHDLPGGLAVDHRLHALGRVGQRQLRADQRLDLLALEVAQQVGQLVARAHRGADHVQLEEEQALELALARRRPRWRRR